MLNASYCSINHHTLRKGTRTTSASHSILKMSAKNISKSTLGLRFMQNAQRAKLQAQVEAEQAKINDDAEWSVSQEVREAWGIESSTVSSPRAQARCVSASYANKVVLSKACSAQSVTHEASYIPFIFGEDEAEEGEEEAGPSRLVRGRRKFNDRGQEVLRKEVRA